MRDPIFDHCGDDEAEQRWEELLEEYDAEERRMSGVQNRRAQPPTDRQRYAMRVSWLETERHLRLRKATKQQWNAQNPKQEEDEIMNAGRKAEDPSIKDAGLSGVAEAAVDPRLMPPPEMVKQWGAQFVEPVAYERSVADAADMAEAQMPNPYVRGNDDRYMDPPLREGASIYDLHGDDFPRNPTRFMTDDEEVNGDSYHLHEAAINAQEAHGLGRFKQGMHTPQVVAERSVGQYDIDRRSVTMSPAGMHAIIDGVEYVRKDVMERETVEEHLIRIGVTYKHRTAANTGRVWLNVPADKLAKAEGRPYTKEKKK